MHRPAAPQPPRLSGARLIASALLIAVVSGVAYYAAGERQRVRDLEARVGALVAGEHAMQRALDAARDSLAACEGARREPPAAP